MSRRQIREMIFKMVFRVEFHSNDEVPEQFRLFLDAEAEPAEDERDYIQKKVADIVQHLEEIDALINELTDNWKTSRMAKVDLAIIRLAVYEMRYDDDVPVGVAINEAVELAKIYGEENSASFVNGVLARIA
ncbi:MAG: transcription antitermination factor NusB [bacterium]|nr:transcription antitermination factor NusB [bacterium]